MIHTLVVLVLLAVPFGAAHSQTLSLPEAVARVRQGGPRGLAAQAAARAEDAEQLLGMARPNPELEVEAEDVGRGSDALETTVWLGQALAPPGRRARQGALRSVQALARDEAVAREAREEEIAVQRQFIETLAQQEIVRRRRELVALSRDAAATARRKFDAGAVAEIDVAQADTGVALAEMELASAERDLASHARRLASWLGAEQPWWARLEGHLPGWTDAPLSFRPIEELPELREMLRQKEQTDIEQELAIRSSLPDVTLRVGMRHSEEDDVAFLAGAAVPLPIFTSSRRAQGVSSLRRAALDRREVLLRRDLEQERLDIATALDRSRLEERHYRENLVPMSERAHALALQGYEAGRISWLHLLQARQELAEMSLRHLEAAREMHLHRIELRRFTNNDEEILP